MTRPVLVTGAAGFAGSHLVDLLRQDDAPVVGWRRPGGSAPAQEAHGVRWVAVDLLDRAAVRNSIADLRPAAVYHCAGVPHVAGSWDNTYDTFAQNVLGTHHLLEAIRTEASDARLLIPGSATVYKPSDAPIGEDHPVIPSSPYGLSKLAQEMLGRQAAAEDGAAVVLTRSFNHIGPRQNPSFVASSIARQLALIEAGRAAPLLQVGNIETRRDLTDVRDTVRAYRALLREGQPGNVYNVCSGRAYAIKDLVRELINRAGVRVEVRIDPSRYRPSDAPVVLGDCRRIRQEIGWRPEIPLERTLSDLLAYWRDRVRTHET